MGNIFRKTQKSEKDTLNRSRTYEHLDIVDAEAAIQAIYQPESEPQKPIVTMPDVVMSNDNE